MMKLFFLHKVLLINRQVSNLCKVFANSSSTDIKLSKTRLFKMMELGGFLDRLVGPLLKTELPLMKNVIKPLAGSVLIPLGLTVQQHQQQILKYSKNLRIWNNNINKFI